MKVKNFDNHLFRCSQLGKLMVGLKTGLTDRQSSELERLLAKSNTDKGITDKQRITLGELIAKRDRKIELSTAVKSHLSDIHKDVFFGRITEIRSKYLDKGIQVEEKSLTLYTDLTKKLYIKNTEYFSNEYIHGTPDIIHNDLIIDIKSSWTLQTFPMHKEDLPSKDYEWQLQGYMNLTGKRDALLAYCLIDTPHSLVKDELRRLDWKHNVFDMYGVAIEKAIPLIVEVVSNLIYTRKGLEEFCATSENVHIDWFKDFVEIPKEFRVKTYEFNYSKEMIEALYGQIDRGREYLNGLTVKLANRA